MFVYAIMCLRMDSRYLPINKLSPHMSVWTPPEVHDYYSPCEGENVFWFLHHFFLVLYFLLQFISTSMG